MGKADLKLAFCTARAANSAAKRWHYSGAIPVGKQVKLGVWEAERFVGCVTFGMGATHQARMFELEAREVAELTRVALARHDNPVSRIVRIALKLLTDVNPLLRIIVSFADPAHGHHGGIYQAGGWIYLGTSAPTVSYALGGKVYHNRSLSGGNFGGARVSKSEIARAKKILNPGKHRYAIALSRADRGILEKMRKPYPSRVKPSIEVPAYQTGEGGAIPTHALQSSEVSHAS